MKEKPYTNNDFIRDIGDLAREGLTDEGIAGFRVVVDKLTGPMVYWQCRWFHRVGYAVFFIWGLSLGARL